jgi:hypothetical protein
VPLIRFQKNTQQEPLVSSLFETHILLGRKESPELPL